MIHEQNTRYALFTSQILSVLVSFNHDHNQNQVVIAVTMTTEVP